MSSSARIPWKESNLALIGSALDHQVKAAAAHQEEQWDSIGHAAGTHVWRIEQFVVKPWPVRQYGKFHTGDSYLVLHSYKKKGSNSDKLYHSLHMWIGHESSQDEYGTAAYKMVECDDALGGVAVQHREVQGRESKKFRAYFGNRLEYLAGGTATGFTHVEASVDVPFLYRVKGTEQGMSLTQVPLRKSALNDGDSFVLVANASTVWVWHGAQANPDEKARASQLGETFCTQGSVVVLEGDDDDEAFWGYLGDGKIAAPLGGDDDVPEFAPILYKLPAHGEPELVAQAEPVQQRWGRPQPLLAKSLLDESDVHLLDGGWEIFVWIGSGSDQSVKLSAVQQAESFARKDPRTMFLPLALVKSGYEDEDFLSYFEE